MEISRRNFLRALSVSAVTVLPLVGTSNAASLAGFGRATSGRTNSLDQLGWNSFYPYLYTNFEFSSTQSKGGSATLARLKLSAMSNTDPTIDRQNDESKCFVLTFREQVGLDTSRLSQATYTVEHFALGRFELFISEGTEVDGEYIYTAVINRAMG